MVPQQIELLRSPIERPVQLLWDAFPAESVQILGSVAPEAQDLLQLSPAWNVNSWGVYETFTTFENDPSIHAYTGSATSQAAPD